MPEQISFLDSIEMLAMLTTAGATYGWVVRRLLGWSSKPTPPGPKGTLRLVPPVCDTEGKEVSSPRLAA
jgi:hypothetical protein